MSNNISNIKILYILKEKCLILSMFVYFVNYLILSRLYTLDVAFNFNHKMRNFAKNRLRTAITVIHVSHS